MVFTDEFKSLTDVFKSITDAFNAETFKFIEFIVVPVSVSTDILENVPLFAFMFPLAIIFPEVFTFPDRYKLLFIETLFVVKFDK